MIPDRNQDYIMAYSLPAGRQACDRNVKNKIITHTELLKCISDLIVNQETEYKFGLLGISTVLNLLKSVLLV